MIAKLVLFGFVLLFRPVLATKIAWWRLTGKRVRAGGHLAAAITSLPNSYRLWLLIRRISAERAPNAGATFTTAGDGPSIVVHLHLADHGTAAAVTTIKSVRRNCGGNCSLIVTGQDPGDALVRACNRPGVTLHRTHSASFGEGIQFVLQECSADWIVVLEPGSMLYAEALAGFDQAIRSLGGTPSADVVYADEDQRDGFGRRCLPWLKPEWDRDLFIAQDYVSSACMLSRCSVEQALATAPSDRLANSSMLVASILLADDAAPPLHADVIAVSRPIGAWAHGKIGRKAGLSRLLNVDLEDGPFGTLAPCYRLTEPPPKVSVIVPTRDRLDLLEPCVRGVLERTDYPNVELIVADNDSVESKTLAFLNRISINPKVRVVSWPHPYNYSAINNFAVAQASGAYVCLLNNDTEVIGSDWLSLMMRQACRQGVGAVGARLLYSDRTIQHAGVVIGMGNAAGHAHRGLGEGKPGYFAQALVPRGAAAVTAACLVVERRKFNEVGGFDEHQLGIAYNDVDLCLKLGAAGYRNIYEARALLFHHEGKSRGKDFAPDQEARYLRELAVLQARWHTTGYTDPMHHRALDIGSEEYRLGLQL